MLIVNATDNLHVTKNSVSTKKIVVFVNALKKIVAKNFQIKFCLRSTAGFTKRQISAQHAAKSYVQNRHSKDIKLHTMVSEKQNVKIAENNFQHWVILLVMKRWHILSVFLKSLKK